MALYLQSGVPNSDYINANFIRVRKMTDVYGYIARYYHKTAGRATGWLVNNT